MRSLPTGTVLAAEVNVCALARQSLEKAMGE
jgi:hypothetical protein